MEAGQGSSAKVDKPQFVLQRRREYRGEASRSDRRMWKCNKDLIIFDNSLFVWV